MNFWRFVWSRKWLLVIPVVLSTVAAAILAYSMPVVYRAESRIMVVPARVPESFVPSSVKTKLELQLDSIRQDVLSRTRLERIVQEFELYAEERQARTIMEDVIQRMRTRDIRIETLSSRDGESAVFTVSFQYAEPRTTMRVTERLASLFINGNIENRSRTTKNTSMFLEGQLDELAAQVDEFAARMERDQLQHREPRRSEFLEYEELQGAYRELLGKRQQARIAANLEVRQIGQQFRILDPARIPTRPEGPGRLTIILFGAGAGFAAGLLLMLAASMRRVDAAPPARAMMD